MFCETGCTGFLGPHLVASLLRSLPLSSPSSRRPKIFCIVRAKSSVSADARFREGPNFLGLLNDHLALFGNGHLVPNFWLSVEAGPNNISTDPASTALAPPPSHARCRGGE